MRQLDLHTEDGVDRRSAITVSALVPELSGVSPEPGEPLSGALPIRDLVLLPLLSLTTILVMFATAEIVTRIVWPASEHGFCMHTDPLAGPHGKPNCTTTVKIAEGEGPVVQVFNKCGYRSEASCGPKPADTFRIAVLGSSISEGYIIPYHQMLASQVSETLARNWHRKVEFQNLGAEACLPIYSYRHLPEALALHPDAAILVINPWDLEEEVEPRLMALRNDPEPITRAPAPLVKLSPFQKLELFVHQSRSLLVAQHYLLQNPEVFLKLYLLAGGDHTDFVHYPLTARWRRRFAVTDILLGEMAERFRLAGIPFVVVAVPERAQVMMLSRPNLPAGVDPYAFTRELSHIASNHGILFVDGLKVLGRAPTSESLFYVVDGHPTPRTHQLLGQAAAALMEARIAPH